MKRADFFKTLFGMATIAAIPKSEPEPEPLSGRKKPITPEDLDEYICKKINIAMSGKLSGKLTVKGSDLIAIN